MYLTDIPNSEAISQSRSVISPKNCISLQWAHVIQHQGGLPLLSKRASKKIFSLRYNFFENVHFLVIISHLQVWNVRKKITTISYAY